MKAPACASPPSEVAATIDSAIATKKHETIVIDIQRLGFSDLTVGASDFPDNKSRIDKLPKRRTVNQIVACDTNTPTKNPIARDRTVQWYSMKEVITAPTHHVVSPYTISCAYPMPTKVPIAAPRMETMVPSIKSTKET